MQHAERTKVLAGEIAGLLLDVRVNIGISRGLLKDASSRATEVGRERVRFVIPEMGFFTWFVAGNLYHGDSLFAALHGLDLEGLSSGLPVEALLSQIDRRDQPHVAKGLHWAISTGDRCSLEYSTVLDGSRRQVAMIGCCLRDAEGQPSFFCGIVVEKKAELFLDVSEPFKAYCDAALMLAKERGNLLAARYLRSALNAAQDRSTTLGSQ